MLVVYIGVSSVYRCKQCIQLLVVHIGVISVYKC